METICFALVPLTVVLSFLVHWLTLVKIGDPRERLPFCRGAYLAMSFQMLLYSWIVFGVVDAPRPAACFIPLGMTLSFAGDFFNLQFDSIARRSKEPVFWGIVSFGLALFCYIGAFLSLAEPSILVSEGYFIPVLAALILLPAIIFRLRVYNPSRSSSITAGAFIYGLILGGMTAVALSAAIAVGGAWYFVAAGALFFLLSDAVMGETTIYGRHPSFEYQLPWFTYLVAQGLIIFGSVMVATGG